MILIYLLLIKLVSILRFFISFYVTSSFNISNRFFCLLCFNVELEADLSRTKKYLHDLAQMKQVQNLMNVMVNPLIRKKRRKGSSRKSSKKGSRRKSDNGSDGDSDGGSTGEVEIRHITKSKKKRKKKKSKKRADRNPIQWELDKVVDDE
jgi:uncharacterized membrane protein YgcG